MKSIPGYAGYYATIDGEIISTRGSSPRVLTKQTHKGYYHVYVRYGIGRHTKVKIPVHKLVLFAFIGPKPTDQHVCRHLNGNALDNRVFNLKWGTVQDNIMDAIKHGTAACLRLGESHPGSKLKEIVVIKIKRLLRKNLSNIEIAKLTGVQRHNVQDIRVGKAWKYLGAG